jgi:membrane protease YdiL (CAAX protease family)
VAGESLVVERRRLLPVGWLPFVFAGPVLRTASFWVAGLIGVDPYGIGRALGIADRSLWSVTVYAFCGAIVALVLLRALGQRGWTLRALGWRAPESAQAYGAALIGVALVIVLWLPVAALAAITGLPMFWQERPAFVGPSAAWEFAVAALVGVVIVPLVEEPLFRGYVLRALAERWQWQLAVLGQAALFGLYHVFVGPGMMLYTFLWAIVPGLIAWRWRSLWPCLLFHALNNVWADLLVPVLFG